LEEPLAVVELKSEQPIELDNIENSRNRINQIPLD